MPEVAWRRLVNSSRPHDAPCSDLSLEHRGFTPRLRLMLPERRRRPRVAWFQLKKRAWMVGAPSLSLNFTGALYFDSPRLERLAYLTVSICVIATLPAPIGPRPSASGLEFSFDSREAPGLYLPRRLSRFRAIFFRDQANMRRLSAKAD